MIIPISGFTIYLILLLTTIYRLGQYLHKEGKPLVREAIEEERLVGNVNRVLLVGYYLLNAGLVLVSFRGWQPYVDWFDMLQLIASHIGFILLILGIFHYFNIVVLGFFKWLKTRNIMDINQ